MASNQRNLKPFASFDTNRSFIQLTLPHSTLSNEQNKSKINNFTNCIISNRLKNHYDTVKNKTMTAIHIKTKSDLTKYYPKSGINLPIRKYNPITCRNKLAGISNCLLNQEIGSESWKFQRVRNSHSRTISKVKFLTINNATKSEYKSENCDKAEKLMKFCDILGNQYKKASKSITRMKDLLKKNILIKKRKGEFINREMRKIMTKKNKSNRCFIYGKSGKGKYIS